MKEIVLSYKYHFYLLTILFFSILSVSACGDKGTNAEDNIVLPESNLNFVDHIQPLFISKCANRNGCHSAFEPARGLNLTDYQTIMTHFAVNTEILVDPGIAERSFLYNILKGPILGVPRMPLEQAPLNSNNINGVKTWINEGAPQFP
jgi:hypothetical protein